MLVISSPDDGTNLTTRDVVIEGCCTAPSQFIRLDSDALSTQSGVNMEWESGALVMSPRLHFNDDFNGPGLNTTRWTIVRDSGITIVQDGELRIENKGWGSPREPAGLVKSTPDIFPTEMDWTAEFKVWFNVTALLSTGLGGGLTPDQMTYAGSLISVNDVNPQSVSEETLQVYALGSSVHSEANDKLTHTIRIDHSSASGGYVVYMDDDLLTTIHPMESPSFFWFGATDTNYQDWMVSQMAIAYVNLWTFNANWQSDPYDFGHTVNIDDLNVKWTSTHKDKVKRTFEARASEDNSNWTDWMAVSEIGVSSPSKCRYMQFRFDVELPSVRDEGANVSISSIDVTYRNPIETVEVRTVDGNWVTADGKESWRAELELVEDLNVIEVRAIDISGAISERKINVTVDTTPPAGTVTILSESRYLNDPYVTLGLNATDRYGVVTVQVSNAPDMSNMRVFPFETRLSWSLGGDGEVSVYVRFVDVHGLVSEVAKASAIVDLLLPSGSLTINGGSPYTASRDVRLDLDYSDNRGVDKVEISNNENMSDALEITPPVRAVETWDLEVGGDGPRTVYMLITDVAGNTVILNSTIALYIPKALGSLEIEGGASFTNKPIVELSIDAPRDLWTGLMQLSNDADFEGATWDVPKHEMSWILSPVDGQKTVYLRFEDVRGIVSLSVKASIIVDTTPPVVDVLFEGGSPYTTEVDLNVTIVYGDANPPALMWLAPNERFDLVESQPFSGSVMWCVPAQEGDWTLNVKVEDVAGNSAVSSASIHYATIIPILSLGLPDGAVSPSTKSIRVEPTVSDPYGDIEVRLAFGRAPGDGDPWVRPDGTLTVEIPPGTPDGAHVIWGMARNAAGLVSDVQPVEVILDRLGPSITIEEPLDGGELVQESLDVRVDYSMGDVNGISRVDYRIDGGEWTEINPAWTTLVVGVEGYGRHTMELRAMDSVGNPSTCVVAFEVTKPEEGIGLTWVALGAVMVLITLAATWVSFHRHSARR